MRSKCACVSWRGLCIKRESRKTRRWQKEEAGNTREEEVVVGKGGGGRGVGSLIKSHMITCQRDKTANLLHAHTRRIRGVKSSLSCACARDDRERGK